jgi:biotin carboxyl carrier protein
MKFKMNIDNVERAVEVQADGTVVVDGKKFTAVVNNGGVDRRLIQVGEGSYELRTVDDRSEAGSIVLELAGERIPLTVTEVSKSKPAPAVAAVAAAQPQPSAAAASETPVGTGPAPEETRDGIFAPVPGKIVDVKVKVGDTVEEGDVVLVLEAMKMENELHATKSGTVTAVLVKRGDQTAGGQLLVAME